MRPGRRHDPAGVRLDDGRARGPLLVGVPGRRVERRAVGEERGHRAHHLGRLVEAAQELVDVEPGRRLEDLPAAVDEDEPGAAIAEDRGRRGDDGPEPVTGEDDAIARVPPSRPEPSATATTSPARVAGS